MRKDSCIRFCWLKPYSSFVVGFVALCSLVHGQSSFSTYDKTGRISQEKYRPGFLHASVVQGDSVISSYTLDMNEDLKVIVQLKSPPLAVVRSGLKTVPFAKLSSAQAQIGAEQQNLKEDLARVEREVLSRPSPIYAAAGTQIRFEYNTAFNGIALTTKRWMVEEIKKLPYVRSVHLDGEVKALDDESNRVIGADSVWARLGATGRGVIIGIIDTGIDYLHPALGSGIGPAKKVLGGYDFVNNDTDPMDDNGHGTHVAGIAAANGDSLKGVAPDAKLMAFKVLGRDGSGQFSWVIAGIERALDPDRNPGTNDAVHVINMSLGGSGDPDDVVSQAVDNAVQSGVVCVVAAGNAGGAGYQTIGSPGNARRALTVGATDNLDAIASFSSRGPSNKIFALKPDVVAPGVRTNSAKMGGGYVRLSGTSMATPHVAGAVALLRELHPTWTPETYKSAMMQSAKDINVDVWTQGSGRVNVYKAARMDVVLTPASLSLGVDDLSQTVWTRSDTLYLHNLSSNSKTYDLSISGSFPSGVNIALNPSTATANPGERTQIVLTTSVNNNVVPFPGSDPRAYTGKILARSSGDTLKVPFAFFKSPILQLAFDEVPWILIVHDRQRVQALLAYPGRQRLILVPSGVYDVMVIFGDVATKVVKEGVAVEQINTLNINKADARHQVRLRTFDVTGQEIQFGNFGISRIGHKASRIAVEISLTFAGRSDYNNLYFNDISSAYKYEAKVMAWSEATRWDRYDFPFALYDGISSSLTLQNDPTKIRGVNYQYSVSPEIQKLFIIQEMATSTSSIANWNSTSTSPNFLLPPFQRTVYFLPNPSQEFAIKYTVQQVYQLVGTSFNHPTFEPSDDTLMFGTAHQTLENDSLRMFRAYDFTSPVRILSPSTTILVGSSPPRWSGRLYNSSARDYILLSYDPANSFGYFLSPFGDLRNTLLSYKLFAGSQLVLQGTLYNRQAGPFYDTLKVSKGSYELQLAFNQYRLQERQGTATAKLRFDTRLPDGNPPYLKSLRVLSGGVDAVVMEQGLINEARFSLRDESPIQIVKLFYRTEDTPVWSEIALSRDNQFYVAAMNLPVRGYISLRVYAQDSYGNSLDYEIEPAVRIGTPPQISSVSISHEFFYVRPGDDVTISAVVTDPDGVSSVSAVISNPGDTVLATVKLFDDGQHNDGVASDNLYAGKWTTSTQKADYGVDIVATDAKQNAITKKNAVSFTTKDVPYVALDRFAFYNNPDGRISQGEVGLIKAYLRNVGTVRTNSVYLTARTSDPHIKFVATIVSAPGVPFGSIEAGELANTPNLYDFSFMVSELAPHDQSVSIVLDITDADGHEWSHKLSFVVVDDAGPFLSSADLALQGKNISPGSPALVKARFVDGSGVRTVTAFLYDAEETAPVDSLPLFDDGDHLDNSASDGWFGNSWTTPSTQRNYEVDFLAIDSLNNRRRFRESGSFIGRFSTFRTGTAQVLLISDYGINRSSSIMEEYIKTLSAGGFNFDRWNAYYSGQPDSSVLLKYSRGIVIWGVSNWGYLTLPSYSTPAYNTIRGFNGYMSSGGRALISGRNVARDLQNDQGQRAFLPDLFHARYVGQFVQGYISGIPGDPISSGIGFNLTDMPLLDHIEPLAPAIAFLQYLDGSVAGVRAQTEKHKIVYLPFDFTSISNASAKQELVRRILNWLAPAPSASKLLFPSDRDSVRLTSPARSLRFVWHASAPSSASDTLYYILRLTGPRVDTTVTEIRDTTVELNIMPQLQRQSTYTWTVRATNGITITSSPDTFTLRTSTVITSADKIVQDLPKEYSLRQNYPNPFNPSTVIEYGLPKESLVSLKVFNILGQEVADVVEEVQPAGRYQVKFDASGLASGLYFYKFDAGEFTQVRKLVIVR